MSKCADKHFQQLRHESEDVVLALREQTWKEHWHKRIFMEYLSGTTESKSALFDEMINEELMRIAKEGFCDEI